MAKKGYTFLVHGHRSLTTFHIRESGISIRYAGYGGSGMVKATEEKKIKRMARQASARDLWEIRMAGFVDIATKARELQKMSDEEYYRNY